MRGFYYAAVTLTALFMCYNSNAQTKSPIKKGQSKVEEIDSVVVSASRAGKTSPIAYSMVNKKELRSSESTKSLPLILNSLPSVVGYTEGASGLGYSYLRVRGVGATQINVTFNGITLNDPESEEVFWVNIPALSSILNSVQLQRGLGTSSNGPGAFGASINMSSSLVPLKPTARISFTNGSFGTLSTVVSGSSGLLSSGLYATAAYSKGYTDGYRDNGYARVQSAYARVGYMSDMQSLSLTWLMGEQHTGLTWDGISLKDYNRDPRYNKQGLYDITDKDGHTFSYRYPHETDNYIQNHFQLNYILSINRNLTWNTTFNFTPGYGYYQQLKYKKFKKFNLKSLQPKDKPDMKSYFETRKYLRSFYNVLTSNLIYKQSNFKWNTGIYLSNFRIAHYGDVLRNAYYGDKINYSSINPWYLNNTVKNEINLYSRADYSPVENLNLYLDLQYRQINLRMKGKDDRQRNLDYYRVYKLFNPRAGVNYNFLTNNSVYASIAMGHREPARADIENSIVLANTSSNDLNVAKSLIPETMYDFELGYKFDSENLQASANLYLMEYRNMLLETGQISPTGYLIKSNAGTGYRRGLEFALAYRPCDCLVLNANLALSQNKLQNYKYYYQASDEKGNNSKIESISFKNTNMLLSPSVVGFASATVLPFKSMSGIGDFANMKFMLSAKYVSSQYWDNTSSKDREIPAYYILDASVNQEFNLGSMGVLGCSFYVNNILNRKYYANASVYRSFNTTSNSWYQEEGVLPQLPLNFMFKTYFNF